MIGIMTNETLTEASACGAKNGDVKVIMSVLITEEGAAMDSVATRFTLMR